MVETDLKQRTKCFALKIIRFVEKLPRSRIAAIMGDQLLRSGTSVGSNYRAACRARSPAEFCAKMGIVEEEADESIYCMKLLVEAGSVHPDDAEDLMREEDEVVAIAVSSIKTARRGNGRV